MKLRSQPARNFALNLTLMVVGALLIYLCRQHADTNTWAGLLLGCLLLLLGLVALLIHETREIELDTRRRMLVLDVHRRVGGDRRLSIPFSDIVSIGIGALGSRSEGSVYHDLVLHTRAGKDIYLMGGCTFEGRMNRDRMEALREEFEGLLGSDTHFAAAQRAAP